MINVIWLFLIVSGISYGLVSGNGALINEEIVASVNSGIELIFNMLPVLILWMGVMRLAQESGLLDKFAKAICPVLHKLFPTLDKNSKALGYIASNIAANMMGLGSAATPFGLKAMQELEKENPKKGEATEAMITFLILNTAGVTIIPTTVIALRMAHGSMNATGIILPSLLATSVASIAGLTLDYIIRRRRK